MSTNGSNDVPAIELEKRKKRKYRTLTLVFGIATLLALGAAIAQIYWNYQRGLVLYKNLFAQGERIQELQKRILTQTNSIQALEKRIFGQIKQLKSQPNAT